MSESNQPLQAKWANYLRSIGLKTFPVFGVNEQGQCLCGKTACLHPGKHPMVKGWQSDGCFASEEEINRHWEKHPNSNYGVVTKGLVVIDVDGPVGAENYERYLRPGLQGQRTFTVKTGNGRHEYYRNTSSPIGNSKLFEKIDTRADGGLVVGPYSLHKTLNRYEVIDLGTDNTKQIHIADLPMNVYDLLAKSSSEQADGKIDIKANIVFGAQINEGSRNIAMASYVGQLVRKNLSDHELKVCANDFNKRLCNPPMEEAEVLDVVQSISGYRKKDFENNHSDDFQLRRLSDLLNAPDKEVAYIVDTLLVEGGFSLLVAKPKVGKTTLLRSLAVAVAQGLTWLEKKTTKGTVIYLALEEHLGLMKQEFKKFNLPPDIDVLIHAAPAPKDAISKLQSLVDKHQPILIIVDTMQKFVRFGDGNSYAEVGNSLEPVLDLARKNNVHIICTHHLAKSDEREPEDAILGSTAIFGAFDTLMFLAKERHTGDRIFHTIQRYTDPLDKHVLKIDENTRQPYLVEMKENRTSSLEDLIFQQIVNHPEGIGPAELRNLVHKNSQAVTDALNALLRQNKIAKDKSGRKIIYKISIPLLGTEQENSNIGGDDELP